MEIIDSPDKFLEKNLQLIESSSIQFNYKILDDTNINEIINFVNLYYFERDEELAVFYTHDILKYYLINSIPMFFYGKKYPDKPVALVIGRRADIMSYNNLLGAIEVNFFCIIPQLRKLNLPKLFRAYFIKECSKKYNNDVKYSYFTTDYKLNVEPICYKKCVHRYINFNNLCRLDQIHPTENTPIYKKLYSKFNYPENFKKYKISTTFELNQIDEITNKINSYQNNHFDIYEYIYSDTIKNINKYDCFYKFVITDNDNIKSVIIFYRNDMIHKKLNEPIRTLRLYYYFADGNIVDYLEYVGDYLKNNNICDTLLLHLFEKNVPHKYVIGTGISYYNLWNVKSFTIEEQRLQLIMI